MKRCSRVIDASRGAAVVKETESVPGMLLISPQAVMFEPTDYQSAAPADDDASTTTTTTTTSCDESAAAQHDCIIVPMDSISSIMISHDCAAAAVSTRSVPITGVNQPHASTYHIHRVPVDMTPKFKSIQIQHNSTET